MYNHLCLPQCGSFRQDCLKRPLHGLLPQRNATTFYFSKTYFFEAYKLFTLYYPAKLRKYTVAACWDFFSLQKKGYIETFKDNRQTDKNTGFNINTI